LEAWLEKIEKIAGEVSRREGCELYDVELVGTGRGRVLRVFIDKDSGVGIEDCSNVSKGLNLLLDVEDVVPGGMYNLEVSSPGLDRHLSKPRHFEKVVGQKIYVQLNQNLGSLGAQDKGLLSMKKFEDTLVAFVDGRLQFKLKNEDVFVPLTALDRARLIFEIKPQGKPGHGKKK
jgi:ribosome maturation factor RimP